jgi:hypothetical protein
MAKNKTAAVNGNNSGKYTLSPPTTDLPRRPAGFIT